MKPQLLLIIMLLPITVLAQKVSETVKDSKIVFTAVSAHPNHTAGELYKSFRTYLADNYYSNGVGRWDRMVPDQFYSTAKTTFIFSRPKHKDEIISIKYTLEVTFKDNKMNYFYKDIKYECVSEHLKDLDIEELRQDKIGLGKAKLEQYRQYTLTGIEKNISEIDNYIENVMVGKRTVQPELGE